MFCAGKRLHWDCELCLMRPSIGKGLMWWCLYGSRASPSEVDRQGQPYYTRPARYTPEVVDRAGYSRVDPWDRAGRVTTNLTICLRFIKPARKTLDFSPR